MLHISNCFHYSILFFPKQIEKSSIYWHRWNSIVSKVCNCNANLNNSEEYIYRLEWKIWFCMLCCRIEHGLSFICIPILLIKLLCSCLIYDNACKIKFYFLNEQIRHVNSVNSYGCRRFPDSRISSYLLNHTLLESATWTFRNSRLTFEVITGKFEFFN